MSVGIQFVWVFMGANARHAGAIFTARDLAEKWIMKHSVTGVLTRYPVDVGVYDWAVAAGFFKPKKTEHGLPSFIGGFTSASMEHFHYENGAEIAKHCD